MEHVSRENFVRDHSGWSSMDQKFQGLCQELFILDNPDSTIIADGEYFAGLEGLFQDGNGTYKGFQAKFKLSKGEAIAAFEESAEKISIENIKKYVSGIEEVKFSEIFFYSNDRGFQTGESNEEKIKNKIPLEGINLDDTSIKLINGEMILSSLKTNSSKYGHLVSKYFLEPPSGFLNYDQICRNYLGTFFTNDALNSKISTIREFLKKGEKQTLRIVGNAGLGKTKLLIEALADVPKNQIIYTAETATLSISDLKTKFLDLGRTGVVILDDVNFQRHQSIEKDLQGYDKIQIITIGRPESSQDLRSTENITLELSDTQDIPKKILESLKGISNSVISLCEKVCDGYPLVAQILVEKLRTDGNLTSEGHQSIFSEISHIIEKFIGKDKNTIEYMVYQAGSICSSICMEELLLLLKEIYKKDYDRDIIYDALQYLVTRRICDIQGNFYIMKPSPIRKKLHKDLIEEKKAFYEKIIIILETIQSSVEGSEILRKYTEEIRVIDASGADSDFVDKMVDGPFQSAEFANSETGSLILSYLAEVNPRKVLEILKTKYLGKSKEEIRAINERRYILYTLQKIAYRAEFFKEAIEIIAVLADAENEKRSNNATGILKDYGRINLSGTAANLSQKLEVAQRLTTLNIDLAISFIGRGLEYGHATRMSGPEYQAGTVIEDYYPKTWAEIYIYRNGLYDIIIENFNKVDELNRERFIKIIEDTTGGLISNGFLDKIEQKLNEIHKLKGGNRPKMMESIGWALNHGALPKDYRIEVAKYFDQFAPQSLKGNIETLIKKGITKNGERKRIDGVDEEMEEIFKELKTRKLISYKEFFDILLTDEVSFGRKLGEKIGEHYKEKEILEFIIEVIEFYKTISPNQINYGLVQGIIKGCENIGVKREIIELFMKNDELSNMCFPLTTSFNFNYGDLEKLIKLAKNDGSLLKNFYTFMYGLVLQHLSNEDFDLFLKDLLQFGTQGQWLVIILVNMSGKELTAEIISTLKSAVLDENLLTSGAKLSDNQMDMFHWEKTINDIEDELSSQEKELIVKQIRNYLISDTRGNDLEIKKITHKYLKNNFETIRNILIGDVKKIDIGYVLSLRFFFKRDFAIGGEDMTPLFGEEHSNYIIERTKAKEKENEDIVIRIASIIPAQSGDNWSTVARKLIDNFGHNKSMLNEIGANVSTKSRSGSAVPVLETEKKLYNELKGHTITEVKERAERNIKSLEKQIEDRKNEEAERWL